MKFKNYGLWASLGALIVMLLNDAFQITPDVTEPYIDLVLSMAIAAGIISNPSKGKGFSDSKKERKL